MHWLQIQDTESEPEPKAFAAAHLNLWGELKDWWRVARTAEEGPWRMLRYSEAPLARFSCQRKFSFVCRRGVYVSVWLCPAGARQSMTSCIIMSPSIPTQTEPETPNQAESKRNPTPDRPRIRMKIRNPKTTVARRGAGQDDGWFLLDKALTLWCVFKFWIYCAILPCWTCENDKKPQILAKEIVGNVRAWPGLVCLPCILGLTFFDIFHPDYLL